MANIKYPPLIEPCKSAIKEGRCAGCQALENPKFVGNKECKYGYININSYSPDAKRSKRKSSNIDDSR